MTDKTTENTKPKSAPVALDIASLDTGTASDNGARIQLLHPTTKEPLELYVTVLGKHSQVFRDIVKERVNRNIRENSVARQRGKPVKDVTAEEAEVEAIELLAACTTGWDSGEGVDYWNLGGENLSFNTANAISVYTRFLWIREQADAAIGDLENFIKA